MTAQAVMTSTHGHPRLAWPTVAKVNIYIYIIHEQHLRLDLSLEENNRFSLKIKDDFQNQNECRQISKEVTFLKFSKTPSNSHDLR